MHTHAQARTHTNTHMYTHTRTHAHASRASTPTCSQSHSIPITRAHTHTRPHLERLRERPKRHTRRRQKSLRTCGRRGLAERHAHCNTERHTSTLRNEHTRMRALAYADACCVKMQRVHCCSTAVAAAAVAAAVAAAAAAAASAAAAAAVHVEHAAARESPALARRAPHSVRSYSPHSFVRFHPTCSRAHAAHPPPPSPHSHAPLQHDAGLSTQGCGLCCRLASW
jgi:hypothetical protein